MALRSAARHGRDHRDLDAFRGLCLDPVDEPHVVIADVHVIPGYEASRFSMTSDKVSPSALTWDSPLVYVRRMVGMRTLTLMTLL